MNDIDPYVPGMMMQQATLVLASIFVSQPEPSVDNVEVSLDMAASIGPI